ncbi:MAG: DUF3781 domain-containing protein [Methanobrevibacter sp.]|nr:DUF3781 domain-containing protein [Methanobrevibacter sp.]
MGLLDNIDKIHTTELGVERIKKNLGLDCDPVEYCISKIQDKDAVIKEKGKNYYVTIDGAIITVNKHSFTIITAHKVK